MRGTLSSPGATAGQVFNGDNVAIEKKKQILSSPTTQPAEGQTIIKTPLMGAFQFSQSLILHTDLNQVCISRHNFPRTHCNLCLANSFIEILSFPVFSVLCFLQLVFAFLSFWSPLLICTLIPTLFSPCKLGESQHNEIKDKQSIGWPQWKRDFLKFY